MKTVTQEQLVRVRSCRECGGTGFEDPMGMVVCNECDGLPRRTPQDKSVCYGCRGLGVTTPSLELRCEECRGTGARPATKYLLITVDDARLLYRGLRREIEPVSGDDHEHLLLIEERFRDDTGGDFEEIASRMKRLETCAACCIEGQVSSCQSLLANKLGRRLYRLIQRAIGEIPAGNQEPKQ